MIIHMGMNNNFSKTAHAVAYGLVTIAKQHLAEACVCINQLGGVV